MRFRWMVAALVAAGCGTPEVTDLACLRVPLTEACPTDDEAPGLLINGKVCQAATGEVISVGAFASSSEVGTELECCYDAVCYVHSVDDG